jgi:acyl-coenzyme A thioesterase PaaI-like protein
VADVRFGNHFLGVHGGAIALLFDELLGIMANAGSPELARAAYINVEYRAITPINSNLVVEASSIGVEVRKRRVRATLYLPGGDLCASAEGLFIQVRNKL